MIIANMGDSSHGRLSHLHAPLFVLYGASRMKHTGVHEDDVTARGTGDSFAKVKADERVPHALAPLPASFS